MNELPASYRGRARQKSSRWSVRTTDKIARALITVGGIGTIVAVCLVFVYLLLVVAPLFRDASIGNVVQVRDQTVPANRAPLHTAIDEYRSTGWSLLPDGRLDVFRLDNGQSLRTMRVFEDRQLTAASFDEQTNRFALAYADGRIQFGRIAFVTDYFEITDAPPHLHSLAVGQLAQLEDSVVERTPQGQCRQQTVEVQMLEAVQVSEQPLVALDYLPPEDAEIALAARIYRVAGFTADRKLIAFDFEEQENDFTGEITLKQTRYPLPMLDQPTSSLVNVWLAGRGDRILAVYEDGQLLRYCLRVPDQPRLVERLDVLPDRGDRVTVSKMLLGNGTLMVGDSQGRLSAWFAVRETEDLEQRSGLALVHRMHPTSSRVLSLGISQRGRIIATGYEDGTVRLFQVTTEKQILRWEVAPGQEILATIIAPKENGLLAITSQGLWQADFDPAHPEATAAALFLPVWYEGYDQPQSIWQSSYATSGPEMKLGMMPLVFGTLKATFYTMFFGAPLALLAAIYSSEFMRPRLRAKVKPVIEMMASLPSVVLGFLAALVVAPFVENYVPATLACFVTVPAAFLLGAQAWQLIPQHHARRMLWLRSGLMVVALPLGVWAAVLLGPAVETLLFAGQIKRWLDGQVGSGVGAWLFLLLPVSMVAVCVLNATVLNPALRRHAAGMSRGRFALLNLAKGATAVLAVGLLAWSMSAALNALGWDPRGTYVSTYAQRNALVVGMLMGFAVIPIIYTIADDALTTVPNHLRSASLGCGATPWQTTVRIVIPTAMSGLFSALMIGLGRAVGETMIVLMAGGNTAIMDPNMFNGFRTLAANIAVEMPEAVPGSTHYRTLFLAALVLFMMTFVVNTAAEVVRLRFRRRAYQL